MEYLDITDDEFKRNPKYFTDDGKELHWPPAEEFRSNTMIELKKDDSRASFNATRPLVPAPIIARFIIPGIQKNMEAEVSSATDDTLYRVKVYTLDGSGQWQDIGTGPIVLDFIEEKQTVSMSVTEENSDNNLLLNVLVVKEDIYNRQQETLIVWAEPDGSNFALSFQEPVGCNNVWDEICKIQRLLSVETVSLPEPQLSNLRDIEMMIQSFSKTYVTRDNLGKFIIESKYIEHLIPVFEECESLYQDLDSQDSLQDLFTISSILRSISM